MDLPAFGAALVVAAVAVGLLAGLIRVGRWGRRKGYLGPLLPTWLFGIMVAAVWFAVTPWYGGTDGAPAVIELELRLVGLMPLGALVCVATVLLLPRRVARVPGIRRSRFPFRAAAAVVGTLTVAGFVALLVTGEHGTEARALPYLGGGIVTLLLMGARRARVPQAERAADLVAEAPVVLLLRGFGDETMLFSVSDVRRARTGLRRWLGALSPDLENDWCTAERYLAPAVGAAIGPMVALGNPSDYLPQDSEMRRFYAPDADWQDELVALVAQARAVLVLAGGSTRSLAWELAHLRAVGAQARTFLVLSRYPPPGLRRSDGHRAPPGFWWVVRAGGRKPVQWPVQVAELAEQGWFLPDTYPGPASVIGFDADGRGRVLISDAATATAIADTVAHALPAP